MKLTKNLIFKNFTFKHKKINVLKILIELLTTDNRILNSLSKNYKNSFSNKFVKKYKSYSNINIIGMGGSILGSRCIYNFLNNKIRKNFLFYDNYLNKNHNDDLNKKSLNLIVSKSGNTLETICNSNVMIKKNHKNIFITENRNSYLMRLAKKLKSDVIYHNNFIGGRYSVLSEVGMLPAELMGLKHYKFKQYDSLIKNKKFINSLVNNVSSTIFLLKKKKFNSIILNYDENSSDLFFWYQQLIAESLGKKGKGFLPVISNMPKDNHSLMQFYLDGVKNNFYTLFFVKDKNSKKINNSRVLETHEYLKNKNFNDIAYSQFLATTNVFKKKKIPFRCFVLKDKSEESLGELFTFFILETLLLGKALKVDPYDQPAVELIKKDTKKFLLDF